MARQRAEAELPPGSSAPSQRIDARRELEAAFHPAREPASPPAGAPHDGQHSAGVVVIKRKRAVLAPIDASSGRGDHSDPAQATDNDRTQEAEVRAPRVFRLEAVAHVDTQDDTPGAGANVLVPNDDRSAVEAQVLDSLPAIPTRRPRRRAAPAVVTFVSAPGAQEVSCNAEAALATDQRLDALLQRLHRLEHTVARIREARSLDVLGDASRQARPHGNRYPSLRSSIEALMQKAEIARRVEAARAVRWIKREMARYGLTRKDVGL
jgi:hypothetical protein